jgi:hypothetical protein
MSVSLIDPNSDAADPDIGAFRNDRWFVADVRRTSKCRHRQKRNNEKSKQSIFHDALLCRDADVPFFGRMRAY